MHQFLLLLAFIFFSESKCIFFLVTHCSIGLFFFCGQVHVVTIAPSIIFFICQFTIPWNIPAWLARRSHGLAGGLIFFSANVLKSSVYHPPVCRFTIPWRGRSIPAWLARGNLVLLVGSFFFPVNILESSVYQHTKVLNFLHLVSNKYIESLDFFCIICTCPAYFFFQQNQWRHLLHTLG